MLRSSAVFLLVVLTLSCDSNQRTPSPPPVPDIALPGAESDAAATQSDGDGGTAADPLDGLRAPTAENLMEFVPELLDGVKARRRQAIKSSPIVHGFYQSAERRIYNLGLNGPTEQEATRRGRYPLLGKDETQTSGPEEIKGLKVGGFDAQRTYDSKRKKSEVVVLVNPFVEVKLSVAPTDDADEAVALLSEIDLAGISKLR